MFCLYPCPPSHAPVGVGRRTHREYTFEGVRAMFAEADANGDGKLNREEQRSLVPVLSFLLDSDSSVSSCHTG